MKLNAHEVNRLDEMTAAELALDRSLQVALNYHANQTIELQKDRARFWNDLGEKHGFNPDDGYSIERVDGFMIIVKKPTPTQPDIATAAPHDSARIAVDFNTATALDEATASIVFEEQPSGNVIIHKNRFGATGVLTSEQFQKLLKRHAVTIPVR